jgi:ABC-type antimicrobial peptide transport system permease subunit
MRRWAVFFGRRAGLPQATSAERFLARAITFYGLIAFLVAAIGVYSVVAYAVEQRTTEFAIRRALGARSAGIVHEVLREATGVMILGLGGGILGAAATGRVLTSQLYGVTMTDLWPYLVCLGAFGIAVSAAALAPAIAAMSVDPIVAIRQAGVRRR